MNLDHLFAQEVQEWHRSQGGFGGDPAGHALRMLREMVELCVASGASEAAIKMSVRRECDKARDRGEFNKQFGLLERVEEFCDVKLLGIIYDNYFNPPDMVDVEIRRKFATCKARSWEADAEGVLWRPGTGPAVPDGSESKAPKTG